MFQVQRERAQVQGVPTMKEEKERDKERKGSICGNTTKGIATKVKKS